MFSFQLHILWKLALYFDAFNFEQHHICALIRECRCFQFLGKLLHVLCILFLWFFLGTAEATIASSAIALDTCLLVTSTYLEKCN